jgi:CRISPR-associated protein Csd2
MSETSPVYTNPTLRHDFLLVFDVTDGNPNGDPDAGNMPRIDPETAHGLVTDVCLKRKIRNYVTLSKENAENYGIFIQEKGILNLEIGKAYKDIGIDLESTSDAEGKARKTKGIGQGTEVGKARKQLCDSKYDIRLFGAVMSTGPNAGQVRGPVQLTFARSIDPIASLEIAITRMAVATEREAESQGGDNRTIGRKAMVPYGLYVAKGFFSPAFAKQTGVTSDDLMLLWDALQNMFDVDRSAARGLMSCRGLYVFTHADERGLGNAPAHKLFGTLKIQRNPNVEAPRTYEDYQVKAPTQAEMPAGITLSALIEG